MRGRKSLSSLESIGGSAPKSDSNSALDEKQVDSCSKVAQKPRLGFRVAWPNFFIEQLRRCELTLQVEQRNASRGLFCQFNITVNLRIQNPKDLSRRGRFLEGSLRANENTTSSGECYIDRFVALSSTRCLANRHIRLVAARATTFSRLPAFTQCNNQGRGTLLDLTEGAGRVASSQILPNLAPEK